MLAGAASEQPLASRGPGRPSSAAHSLRGPAPPGGAPSRPCAARTGAKMGSLTPAVSASRSTPSCPLLSVFLVFGSLFVMRYAENDSMVSLLN